MALHDALDDDDYDDDGALDRTYLTFTVGSERYAIAVAHVTEIVRLQRTYAMPDVPHYMRGVINLRGRVLPLIDLRRRINLDDIPYTDRTLIIVLTTEDGVMTGLVVDSVDDVVEIPEDALEPAARRSQDKRTSMVSAVGKVGEHMYFILNLGSLCETSVVASPSLHPAETGPN